MNLRWRPPTAEKAALAFLMLLLFIRLVERLFLYRQIMPGSAFVLVPVVWMFWQLVVLRTPLQTRIPLTAFFSIIAIFLLPTLSMVLQNAFVEDFIGFDGASSLGQLNFIWQYGLTWFLIGLCVSPRGSEFPAIASWVFFVLSTLLVFSNTKNLQVDYWAIRTATGSENFSHLWISESMIIFMFAVCATLHTVTIRVIFAVICTMILVVIGGRSAILFFFATITAFEVFVGARLSGIRALSIIGLFSAVVFLMPAILAISGNSKVVALLDVSSLANDDSLQERMQALRVGLSALDVQAAFGNAPRIARDLGKIGFYIHNALSAWQFFGLPFFLVVVATLWSGLRGALRMSPREVTTFNTFQAYIILYVVQISLFTVYIGSSWIWFAMGLSILAFSKKAASQ